jgi:hypothetical protein
MRGVPRERRAEDARRARDDPDQIGLRVEVEVVEDAEALAQRCRQHAGTRGGGDEGEGAQRVLQRARVHALVDHEVHREVLHRGIEQLLHRPREPVHFVDEHDVAGA